MAQNEKLSDEEFAELEETYRKQQELREAEKQAAYEAYLTPIQEFVYSDELTFAMDKATELRNRPETTQNRTHVMALDAAAQAIENLRRVFPPQSGQAAAA